MVLGVKSPLGPNFNMDHTAVVATVRPLRHALDLVRRIVSAICPHDMAGTSASTSVGSVGSVSCASDACNAASTRCCCSGPPHEAEDDPLWFGLATLFSDVVGTRDIGAR